MPVPKKTARLVPHLFVVDRDAIVTEEQAVLLYRAGVRVIERCVGHPTMKDQDLTAEELDRLITPNANRGGFGVLTYGYYRDADHTPDNGAADAKLHLAQWAAAGCAPGSTHSLDLEASHWGPDVAGFAEVYIALVNEPTFDVIANPGDGPESCAYDFCAVLTTQQKDALNAKMWWGTPATQLAYWHRPTMGYVLLQSAQTTVAGVVVDKDAVVDGMPLYPNATVHESWSGWDTAVIMPPPRQLPTPDPKDAPFTFVRGDAESAEEAVARCMEELLDVEGTESIGHTKHPARYASYIDGPTQPAGFMNGHAVADISSWSTSCEIVVEAAERWAGIHRAPPTNGQGFFAVFGNVHVKWDGKTVPPRGAELYWASNGTNGHTEIMLRQLPNGDWETAGGGGGKDGTETSIRRHPHGVDPYGRPLVGWWLPSIHAGEATIPPPPPTLPTILDLHTVAGVQGALKRLGHDPGPVDGIIGVRTRAAAKAFQAAVGLPATGVVDDATREALQSALDKQASA